MLAALCWIALRTAQLTTLRLYPLWTIAWRLSASYDAFRTGTQSARLIFRIGLTLIGNLWVLEHATELALTLRITSRLKRIVRLLRIRFAALALEVTVGVDARRRVVTTVRLQLALIDVDTVIFSHFVAGLAFAVIPKIIPRRNVTIDSCQITNVKRRELTIPAYLCRPKCLCIHDYLSYTHLNLSHSGRLRSRLDIHTCPVTRTRRHWDSADHKQAHNRVRCRRSLSCMCTRMSHQCWCRWHSHRSRAHQLRTHQSPRNSICQSACGPRHIHIRRIRRCSRIWYWGYNDVLSRRPALDTHLYLKCEKS